LIESLVEMDIKNTEQKQELLRNIVFYSARVLLIARAVEAKSEKDVFDNFKEHFIDSGFVDSSVKELIGYVEQKNYEGLLEKC